MGLLTWLKQKAADAAPSSKAPSLKEEERLLAEPARQGDDDWRKVVDREWDLRTKGWRPAVLEWPKRLNGGVADPHLLELYVLNVFRFVFPARPDLVRLTLPLLRPHPEIAARMFAAIAATEQKRRTAVARLEQELADDLLRQWLIQQILMFLYRGPDRVADADGRLRRVLEALAVEHRGTLRWMEANVRTDPYRMPFDNRDYFTGGLLRLGSPEFERYVDRLRSLAGRPTDDLLGCFNRKWVRDEFWRIENPRPPASVVQWLALWEELDRRPAPAVDLLAALSLLPHERPSNPPPAGWWQQWEQCTASCEPARLRRILLRLCAVAGDAEGRQDDLGPALARAALWGAVPLADAPLCAEIASFAARWVKTAELNLPLTAVRALERVATPDALLQLQQLGRRIKHKTVQRVIEKSIENMARKQGIDGETLRDRSVEDYGLDGSGVRAWPLGDYAGELTLAATGAVEVCYRNCKTGQVVRSLPAAVKQARETELAELRDTAKRLRAACSLQKARLEQAMVDERRWSPAAWQDAFGRNPLLRNLAARLVWRIGEAEQAVFAMPVGDGAWIDAAGRALAVDATAPLAVAHPLHCDPEELDRWRRCVVARRLVQPFKQVYRETYVLTPPEERTETYSNRFAAQMVRHRPLYALIKERGWSGMGYEGDTEGYRDFPAHGYRAVVLNSDAGEQLGADFVMTLDRVYFQRLTPRGGVPGTLLRLSSVPPVVFSEAMRDVDLFVAVAGAGSDPNWEDWETRRERDHRAWADLRAQYERVSTASADQRSALLRELLPALGLGEQVRLEGRSAIVQGRRHAYRVHLGSGNIHTEPDGRYICIVPDRRGPRELYLPFEEPDLRTAEILSKIMLLADDHKIKDPSILRQL